MNFRRSKQKEKTQKGDTKMVLVESTGAVALAAGIALFGGAIATAWAQSAIGSSAMGVIAEKPEQATKLIIWLAIPETIVIFGFVIALLLTLNLGAPAA